MLIEEPPVKSSVRTCQYSIDGCPFRDEPFCPRSEEECRRATYDKVDRSSLPSYLSGKPTDPWIIMLFEDILKIRKTRKRFGPVSAAASV